MIYLMMVLSSFILCSQATDLKRNFSDGEVIKYYKYRNTPTRKYYEGTVTKLEPFTMKSHEAHDSCLYSIAKERTLDGVAAVDKEGNFFYMEKTKNQNVENTQEMLQNMQKSKEEKMYQNSNASIENQNTFSPGQYIIVSTIGVGQNVNLDEGFLPAGTLLTIVQIVVNEEDRRIRGKLDDGRWISIKNLDTGKIWVTQHLIPFSVGDRLCVVTAFDKFKTNDIIHVTDNHSTRGKVLPSNRRGTVEVTDNKGNIYLIRETEFDKLQIIIKEKIKIGGIFFEQIEPSNGKILKDKERTSTYKNWKNQSEYKGKVNQKGERHGYGVMTYPRFSGSPDGDELCEISGQWQNNIPSGNMILISYEKKYKYKYEGELNAILFKHGHGKEITINHDENMQTEKEGGWKNNNYHGFIKTKKYSGISKHLVVEIEGQYENGREIGVFSHFEPDSRIGQIFNYQNGYYYQYRQLETSREYLVDGYQMDQIRVGEIITGSLEANHVDSLSLEELEIALTYRKQNTYPMKNKKKKKEILKKRQDALKQFLEGKE